jgi:hypothetical protein
VDLGGNIDLEAADTITVPRNVPFVISSTVKPVKATFVNCQLEHSQYGRIREAGLHIRPFRILLA